MDIRKTEEFSKWLDGLNDIQQPTGEARLEGN